MSDHAQPSIPVYREQYHATIGVEVHVQLSTNTKLFCRCANVPLSEPNTHICELCTGQPGALPVLNEAVVQDAIKVAIATNCTINRISEFSRKHYFYPDLPKGFQITQADLPIASHGQITVHREDGSSFIVRINRIHIEEDAGKSIHSNDGNYSFVDLNRAGTPLLEIVSEPDMHSPADVRAYLKELHAIVTSLGVCSGNMEEGAFRADTNVSVALLNASKLGTRCELKNINSFKFISDAVIYEIDRQIDLLEQGEKIIQQTRLWDTRQKTTVPMRSKEEAADYRYMPEPDLPLLIVEEAHVGAVRNQMPELANQRSERFQKQYHLSKYEADIVGYDTALSSYFEQAAKNSTSPKLINWILRDLLGYLKEQNLSIQDCLQETAPLRPQQLTSLVNLVEQGTINARTAQEVFLVMAKSGAAPEKIVQEQGLGQIGSTEEITKIMLSIIEEFPQQVTAYRGGNVKLWGFFIGKAMEKTKGRAEPKLVNSILKDLLEK